MTQAKHLLLTAIGGYTETSLATEEWSVGVRLALVFGSVDPIGTLPDSWDPSSTVINRTETSWTITGNWFVDQGGHTFSPDDYLNDIAGPAFRSWIATADRNSVTQLRTLKLSPIGSPDGKVVPAPPFAQGTPCVLEYTGTRPVGTNSTNLLPLQNACVVSHRTGQIGRHGRGRMYVPGLSVNMVDRDGLLTPERRNSILTSQVTLLRALTYTPLIPADGHVQPIVTGKPFLNYATITEVRADTVVDTQRRRRDQLVGASATQSVAD